MTRPFQYAQLPFKHQSTTFDPINIDPSIWPQSTWISSSAPRSVHQSRTSIQAVALKPPISSSQYVPELSMVERALQMTGTYHPPPVSYTPPTLQRRSWTPTPRAVGSSYRYPSVDSTDMDDSPPISTPRDLSEIPIAIYGEENVPMDSFRDASSSETKSDMSCWNDSPSPRMKFSSPEACKASGPPEAPDVIKRRFAKKRLAKSSSPRRTSARLSKIKAEVIETKEPIVIRPQIEPDLRTISMEACFGDSSECSDSDTDGHNDSNTSLVIDFEVPTSVAEPKPRQSSRAAARTANEIIVAALNASPTPSPERELFESGPSKAKRKSIKVVPKTSPAPPELSDTDFLVSNHLPCTQIYKDGAKRPRVQKLPNPIPDHNLSKPARGRHVPCDPSQIRSRTVHVCPIPSCGACFSRREHVKRHVRGLHTEEKPYKCLSDGCGKAFSRRDNLGLHYTNLHKMSKAKMQEMLGLLDTVLPATL